MRHSYYIVIICNVFVYAFLKMVLNSYRLEGWVYNDGRVNQTIFLSIEIHIGSLDVWSIVSLFVVFFVVGPFNGLVQVSPFLCSRSTIHREHRDLFFSVVKVDVNVCACVHRMVVCIWEACDVKGHWKGLADGRSMERHVHLREKYRLDSIGISNSHRSFQGVAAQFEFVLYNHVGFNSLIKVSAIWKVLTSLHGFISLWCGVSVIV